MCAWHDTVQRISNASLSETVAFNNKRLLFKTKMYLHWLCQFYFICLKNKIKMMYPTAFGVQHFIKCNLQEKLAIFITANMLIQRQL